ncbi:osmolarity sensor protein EnvZ [mine drainage metagenome]|uniref:histidine kinase n=1 Tax=mine drainage metagenome TaxID=410659 RepID=A0A1J5RG30_9ZZZZ
MSLLPRSLFGRTLLVLIAGLMLAEIASLGVNFFDRGSGVYRLGAQQTALRIAQSARILNRLDPRQRAGVIDEMNGTNFSVVLRRTPAVMSAGFDEHDRYELALATLIKRYLRSQWATSVQITSLGRASRPKNYEAVDTTPLEQWIARHFYFILPGAYSIVAQIRLEDGTTAVFYARIPQEPLSRIESLLPRLLLNLAIFALLGAAAVGAITRSLERLAHAAEQLGVDPEGKPLPEHGPSEVRSVIRAFNRMRLDLRSYLLERARMLGAISHDLRTPITRLRLRAEMIENAESRAKFVRDLDEIDAMAGSALEFFKSLGSEPQRHPVDVAALVGSLCEDWFETGRDVTVSGTGRAPYNCHPQALRRCLDNLVENALRYGGRARISVTDDGAVLRISVRDDGPGIPEQDLERVFEPFFRLEQSRNRDSGGTGLGLAIARNIARWHGGDIHLRNAPDGGGLIAELSLPRFQSRQRGS